MEKYEGIQKSLDEFVLGGGNVSDLDKNHPLYRRINKAVIVNDKGEKLSLEEKFIYFHHARPAKKQTGVLERITQALDVFVASGKSVDNLTVEDPEYKMVNDANIKGPNGKRLTVSEIFALAGHPRREKRTSDIEKKLVNKIEDHLKAGKTFHMKRKDLPFYEDLRTYCRSIGNVSSEQAMHSLGYREYSDIYYRYGELQKMREYRDQTGYVDKYRRDKKFDNFVTAAAESLDMPIPIVISLICDENTETTFLQTDYINYVKEHLKSYIQTYETLEGISRINPVLHGQLKYLRESVFTDLGDEITNEGLLYMLDIDGVKNNFVDYRRDRSESKNTMNSLLKKSRGNCGKLSRKDMTSREYYLLLKEAVRNGVTVEAYLKAYDIDYEGGRNSPRLSRMKVACIPYIDEMKKRRDELISLSGVSIENGNCQEEVFEKHLEACIQAYSEYVIHYNEDYGRPKGMPNGAQLRRG